MDAALREELASRCLLLGKRIVPNSSETPCKWFPLQVRNPETGKLFTDQGAWEFVADLLQDGHPFKEVILRRPPGAKAYEALVEGGANRREIYIKIMEWKSQIAGRSFHLSDYVKQVRS